LAAPDDDLLKDMKNLVKEFVCVDLYNGTKL
jgi:hypothetical protein